MWELPSTEWNRNNIGPDLTGIGEKFDRRSLADAIINPDDAIVFGYEGWLVKSKSGDTYYGFLVADGKDNIVLKDASGNRKIIATKNIQTREKQKSSLMM